jgi:hypothetical protein
MQSENEKLQLEDEYRILVLQRSQTMGTLAVDDEIIECRNNRIKKLEKILNITRK